MGRSDSINDTTDTRGGSRRGCKSRVWSTVSWGKLATSPQPVGFWFVFNQVFRVHLHFFKDDKYFRIMEVIDA